MLKTGELLVERRRCPVVPNLPLARWCSRLHLDLALLGPAPCASSLISALRLSSILQLIAEKLEADLARTSRCASSIAHPAHETAHLVHESFLLLSSSSALRITLEGGLIIEKQFRRIIFLDRPTRLPRRGANKMTSYISCALRP